MTHPDRALLQRAAELLEREAATIAFCHCYRGDWTGDLDAKADHDEMLSVAAELRRHIGTP